MKRKTNARSLFSLFDTGKSNEGEEEEKDAGEPAEARLFASATNVSVFIYFSKRIKEMTAA
ncbi:hypothetical protein DQG23_06290 [Paenibacillus contaminans]|uniref:Uncharacterized protein n=1 Tax=Paenibacillus contaminans TaxID=450362 RepID=A0A329MSL6_9BACL|nr:hypothetical protein DQG23_06290 [Paenibacillus contaminans]